MKSHVFPAICVLAVSGTLSIAQDVPSGPEPEHKWLEQFAGEWTTQTEALMGPDQPPVKSDGTMSSRMIGGIWVTNEMKSEFMGIPTTGLQTIGYDPKKQKYVGTWVDSMMNHMWQYEGSVDSSGKKLTLDTEGPSFSEKGKTTMYRDAYEFISKDEILATSSMLGDNGKWVQFMSGTIKRRKASGSQ